MSQLKRHRDCEGQHHLHDAVMEAYSWRHTHDVHSLFIYIDEQYRANHTPQTWYAAIRDAIAHMWCQGLLKETPSEGWFTLSTCSFYDEPPPKVKQSRRSAYHFTPRPKPKPLPPPRGGKPRLVYVR